jgi:hypothetical protein
VTERHKKPALFAGHEFTAFAGGEDPALVSAVAHEVARALLSRVRADANGIALERAMAYVDENGLDDLAELWSATSAHSLPGALWRLYVVRDLIHRQASEMSVLYARGAATLHTVDPVIAGAPTPAGPDEMNALADDILRGVFAGDFADALERAAAFCTVVAAGCVSFADEADAAHPSHASSTTASSRTSAPNAHNEQARALTQQALRLSHTATEFRTCASLWRRGSLD